MTTRRNKSITAFSKWDLTSMTMYFKFQLSRFSKYLTKISLIVKSTQRRLVSLFILCMIIQWAFRETYFWLVSLSWKLIDGVHIPLAEGQYWFIPPRYVNSHCEPRTSDTFIQWSLHKWRKRQINYWKNGETFLFFYQCC